MEVDWLKELTKAAESGHPNPMMAIPTGSRHQTHTAVPALRVAVDRISALESELAAVKAERDESNAKYAKQLAQLRNTQRSVRRLRSSSLVKRWIKNIDGWAAKARKAETELASSNERAAGLAAALAKMTSGHYHEDGHCALRPDLSIASCEAVNIARQALSASGFEVVKDGDKYIVTQKGAEHEAG